MESQGNDIALGLAGFNISPSFTQYLGSMLIKDLRGTESTQDACAKMRVRRAWGQGLHLQPVVWMMGIAGADLRDFPNPVGAQTTKEMVPLSLVNCPFPALFPVPGRSVQGESGCFHWGSEG